MRNSHFLARAVDRVDTAQKEKARVGPRLPRDRRKGPPVKHLFSAPAGFRRQFSRAVWGRTVHDESSGMVDLSIGSALDIFGGSTVRYADCVAFNHSLLL